MFDPTDHPDPDLIEGDEAPPDLDFHPITRDGFMGDDPHLVRPPGKLPPESLIADLNDKKGLGDTCG